MGQSWTNLLFAHWPVSLPRLRQLVPHPLQVQLWDGKPWVGVTPFCLEALRPYRLPPPPVGSRFPEVNVRTYVEHNGFGGIYFLSLDAASLGAVLAARLGYRLPYFYSIASLEPTSDGWWAWANRRRPSGEELRVRYRPVGESFEAPDDPFTRWAAERYRLFNVSRGGTVRHAEIHHRPWQLHDAEAKIETNSMGRPFDLDLEGDPILHFAAPQDVLIWPLTSRQVGE